MRNHGCSFYKLMFVLRENTPRPAPNAPGSFLSCIGATLGDATSPDTSSTLTRRTLQNLRFQTSGKLTKLTPKKEALLTPCTARKPMSGPVRRRGGHRTLTRRQKRRHQEQRQPLFCIFNPKKEGSFATRASRTLSFRSNDYQKRGRGCCTPMVLH
jgi:hypothetical protein